MSPIRKIILTGDVLRVSQAGEAPRNANECEHQRTLERGTDLLEFLRRDDMRKARFTFARTSSSRHRSTSVQAIRPMTE